MTTTRKTAGLVLAMVCLAALAAQAQTTTTALPTSVDVIVIPANADPATATPVATRNTVIATVAGAVTTPNAQCNQPMPALQAGTVTNPTRLFFDDPFNAGRACFGLFPVGLADGSYQAVGVLRAPSCNPAGTVITPCDSVRSAPGLPSPFAVASRVLRTAAPTAVAVQP